MSKALWLFEDDYKHYRNFDAGGTFFATTRALDFAPVFAEPKAADLMTAGLVVDCAHYGVKLWAFVVMPTHIHLLADLPEGQTASHVMDKLKANSAKRVSRVLSPATFERLAVQQGLGRRSFWQRSFRSVPIDDRKAFATKVDYIYSNPMKAGLCPSPAAYRWSSAWMVEAGHVTWDDGLVLPEAVMREFADEAALRLRP